MSEMIPAWRDGALTPVEKLEVHRLGLRHKAVSVFVTAGEKVLLQQRASSKYHTPGLWANTCCTHPHWNEPPRDCAIRRLQEELGITGLAPEWRQRVEYRADVGNGLIEHEIVDIFLARVAKPKDLPIDPNPEEVAAMRWIGLSQLTADATRRPERYTPWLRVYLQHHTDAIFSLSDMLA